MLPRKGTIRLAGQDITKLPSHERSALGIALVPEGRKAFPFLTVLENLEMGGFKFRRDSARVNTLIRRMYTMFPRLEERKGQRAGTLSGGEQQMLVIGRALMSEPRLLCLDEPSLGLAPVIVQDIFRHIREINQSGTSVLLVEQNARYALDTAQRGYVPPDRQCPDQRHLRSSCVRTSGSRKPISVGLRLPLARRSETPQAELTGAQSTVAVRFPVSDWLAAASMRLWIVMNTVVRAR